MSFSNYVDPFYGNFEPDLPEPDKTASKWFFLKAQAGNTLPAAVRPFGMVSACAYTGGYASGYGPYKNNSYARPPQMMDKNNMTALGFSHFHQSGTGYIGEFYNWSVITPYAGETMPRLHRMPLTEERASVGYYGCRLGGTDCEVTVTDTGAIYQFSFIGDSGSIVFDPLLNGIFLNDVATPLSPLGKTVSMDSDGIKTVASAVDFGKGFTLYTAISCPQSKSVIQDDEQRYVFHVIGRMATVYVAFSFKSEEKATDNLATVVRAGFDTAKADSEALWEQVLGRIVIDADDQMKGKFYSNLYRCLIKPIRLTDNSAFFDGDCYCDLATMWDLSKTHLPLLFTLFPQVSGQLINSFLNFYDFYGYFPNECLLTKNTSATNVQARALTVNTIYDAYVRGVTGVDYHRALDCMVSEMENAVNAPFFQGQVVSEFPSQTIDLCVAAHSIALLAEALGETAVADKYFRLEKAWTALYDEHTGLLTEDGRYYEGCNANYSFRLLPDMDKRIALAGGPERFEALLDDFFGFTKAPVKQCLDPADRATLAEGVARRGFEGFNNETDMETPYNYCYIGRMDKTCRIVRSGEKYMFGTGRGALPGNEDSGALSSLYVVNALGIFPVMGQNKIILGSPAVKGAEIRLANDRILTIKVDDFSDDNITPQKIVWRGSTLDTPFITVTDLMDGGELQFIM